VGAPPPHMISASSAPDDPLVEALTCPICFRILDQPCAFGPCNHTFCRSCLISWADARIAHDLEEAGDDDDYALLCQGTPLNCPVCRRTGLPSMSVASSYQTNAALEAAVAAMRTRHRSQPMCELHDRALDFYCADCNEASCGHCGLLGRHRGHQLRDVSEDLLSDLDAQIESSREKINSLCQRRVEFDRARMSMEQVESVCEVRVERAKAASPDFKDALWAQAQRAQADSLRANVLAEMLLASHDTGQPPAGRDGRELLSRDISASPVSNLYSVAAQRVRS